MVRFSGSSQYKLWIDKKKKLFTNGLMDKVIKRINGFSWVGLKWFELEWTLSYP